MKKENIITNEEFVEIIEKFAEGILIERKINGVEFSIPEIEKEKVKSIFGIYASEKPTPPKGREKNKIKKS